MRLTRTRAFTCSRETLIKNYFFIIGKISLSRGLLMYDVFPSVFVSFFKAIVTQRDMKLLKKWTTPECFQLINSSKDFFDTCKVVPVILDVYDTDVIFGGLG